MSLHRILQCIYIILRWIIYVSLFVCLFVCLIDCLFVCLFVCLFWLRCRYLIVTFSQTKQESFHSHMTTTRELVLRFFFSFLLAEF